MAAKTIVLKSKRDKIYSPAEYKDCSMKDTVAMLRSQSWVVDFVEHNDNDYTYKMVKR